MSGPSQPPHFHYLLNRKNLETVYEIVIPFIAAKCPVPPELLNFITLPGLVWHVVA
jgi:hypothetical protein